jgi:hypothetical protein
MNIHQQVAAILVMQAIVYFHYWVLYVRWLARGRNPNEFRDADFWSVLLAFGLLATIMWAAVVLPQYLFFLNGVTSENTAHILGSGGNQLFVYVSVYCLLYTVYDFFVVYKKHIKSFIALFK